MVKNDKSWMDNPQSPVGREQQTEKQNLDGAGISIPESLEIIESTTPTENPAPAGHAPLQVKTPDQTSSPLQLASSTLSADDNSDSIFSTPSGNKTQTPSRSLNQSISKDDQTSHLSPGFNLLDKVIEAKLDRLLLGESSQESSISDSGAHEPDCRRYKRS